MPEKERIFIQGIIYLVRPEDGTGVINPDPKTSATVLPEEISFKLRDRRPAIFVEEFREWQASQRYERTPSPRPGNRVVFELDGADRNKACLVAVIPDNVEVLECPNTPAVKPAPPPIATRLPKEERKSSAPVVTQTTRRPSMTQATTSSTGRKTPLQRGWRRDQHRGTNRSGGGKKKLRGEVTPNVWGTDYSHLQDKFGNQHIHPKKPGTKQPAGTAT